MSSVAPTRLSMNGPLADVAELELHLGPQVAGGVVVGPGHDEQFAVDDDGLTLADIAGSHGGAFVVVPVWLFCCRGTGSQPVNFAFFPSPGRASGPTGWEPVPLRSGPHTVENTAQSVKPPA